MKGSLTYLECSPLKASLALRLLPSFLLHTTEKLQQKLEKKPWTKVSICRNRKHIQEIIQGDHVATPLQEVRLARSGRV